MKLLRRSIFKSAISKRRRNNFMVLQYNIAPNALLQGKRYKGKGKLPVFRNNNGSGNQA
jgi:hypothetical protein